MIKTMNWAAVALLALAGCSAPDQGQPVADVVSPSASPSEGARVVNENPTSPTVDVPNTPRDEASAPRDGGSDAPTTPPAEAAPAPADQTGRMPPVIDEPREPTPDVKDSSAPERKEDTAPAKDEEGAGKSR